MVNMIIMYYINKKIDKYENNIQRWKPQKQRRQYTVECNNENTITEQMIAQKTAHWRMSIHCIGTLAAIPQYQCDRRNSMIIRLNS